MMIWGALAGFGLAFVKGFVDAMFEHPLDDEDEESNP